MLYGLLITFRAKLWMRIDLMGGNWNAAYLASSSRHVLSKKTINSQQTLKELMSVLQHYVSLEFTWHLSKNNPSITRLYIHANPNFNPSSFKLNYPGGPSFTPSNHIENLKMSVFGNLPAEVLENILDHAQSLDEGDSSFSKIYPRNGYASSGK